MDEETCNWAIDNLQKAISTEGNIEEEEHELYYKLQSLQQITGYLDIEIQKGTALRVLFEEIEYATWQIEEYIQEENLQEIKFVKDEREELKKLRKMFKNKEYQTVHHGVDEEYNTIEEHSKTKKEHLEELHKKFHTLTHHSKKKHILQALRKDNLEKDEKYKKIKHFFHEIHKFSRRYQHVLWYLWSKEHHLLKVMKKKLSET